MRHTPSRRHESCSTSQAARVIRKASDPGSSERRGYTQVDAQIRYADRRAKRYDKRARRGDTQADSQKGIINESYADRLAKQYYNRARRGNTQTDRLTHSDPGIVVLFGQRIHLSLCGWTLLNHGVADTKRLNLGNLNPIYERDLTKLALHQGEGRWSVSKNGARGRGCRHK